MTDKLREAIDRALRCRCVPSGHRNECPADLTDVVTAAVRPLFEAAERNALTRREWATIEAFLSTIPVQVLTATEAALLARAEKALKGDADDR